MSMAPLSRLRWGCRLSICSASWYRTVSFVAAIVGLCVGPACVSAAAHYKTIDYDWDNIHKLILIVASLLGDLFVLNFHCRSPPHPKFLLIPKRRFSIRLHLISGTAEIICGIACFLVDEPRIPALMMATIALSCHCTTALFQTNIVFGMKAVMIPAYVFVIGLHAYFAARLLADPNSFTLAINQLLVLHIYVWCRILYAGFARLGIFGHHRYSVAITLSGLIVIPAVAGYAANMIALVCIIVLNVVYRAARKMNAYETSLWFSEKHRETIDGGEGSAAMRVLVRATSALSASPSKTFFADTLTTAFTPGENVRDKHDGDHARVQHAHAIDAGPCVQSQSLGSPRRRNPPEQLPRLGSELSADATRTAQFVRAFAAASRATDDDDETDRRGMARQTADSIFAMLDTSRSGRVRVSVVVDFFEICGVARVLHVEKLLVEVDGHSTRLGDVTPDALSLLHQADTRATHPLRHDEESADGAGSPAGTAAHVTLDGFVRWFLAAYEGHLAATQGISTDLNDEREIAQCIFSRLDADKSGYLELCELHCLLVEWGLPVGEAEEFLRLFDDGDGRIDFGEFVSFMRPVWLYAYGILREQSLEAQRMQRAQERIAADRKVAEDKTVVPQYGHKHTASGVWVQRQEHSRPSSGAGMTRTATESEKDSLRQPSASSRPKTLRTGKNGAWMGCASANDGGNCSSETARVREDGGGGMVDILCAHTNQCEQTAAKNDTEETIAVMEAADMPGCVDD